VPVPVGEPCVHCHEPIVASDDGWLIPQPGTPEAVYHRACFVRSIIGSVAHVEHRCSCWVPGSSESDPPGMSLREAAEAALAAFER
jgi:hypothetical protein